MPISEFEGNGPIRRTSSEVSPIEMPSQGCGSSDRRSTSTSHGAMLALPPRSGDRCGSTDSRSPSLHLPQSSDSIKVRSSLSSSPPDGPSIGPRGLPIGCLCMAQPSEMGSIESSVLDIPLVSTSKITPQDTMHIDTECTSLNNTLRLFEGFLQGDATTSGIWNKTRRLVISDKPGRTDVRICKSMWLPLADLQYTCYGTEVVLRWSDCNQKRKTRLGDSNLTFSRVYTPLAPNNEVHITFRDNAAVQRFIYCITHADLDTAILWRRIGTPSTQELRVFKARQKPTHYVLHVSKPKGHEIASKMFIQEANPVFDIWSHLSPVAAGCGLSIRFCGEVSTPNYLSSVVDKPSDDESVIGRCARSTLVFDTYTLTFPPNPETGAFKLSTGVSSDLSSLCKSLTITRIYRDTLLHDRLDHTVLCIRRQGDRVRHTQQGLRRIRCDYLAMQSRQPERIYKRFGPRFPPHRLKDGLRVEVWNQSVKITSLLLSH